MMKAKIFVGPKKSGKTMLAETIMNVIGIHPVFIAAREFTSDFLKNGFSPFLFSKCTKHTNIIVFDDVPKDFPYEILFGLLSEKGFIQVEKQGSSKYRISSKNIHFIITTQHPVKSLGASFDIRFDIIEFPLAQLQTN